MKTIIFCGGYGTRLNNGKPGPLKPLIKINKKPIIQYIFEIYNRYGYKDFYLLGGYKIQELIKFSKKFKSIYKLENKNFKVIWLTDEEKPSDKFCDLLINDYPNAYKFKNFYRKKNN